MDMNEQWSGDYLKEWGGGTVWRGTKGKKLDNCNDMNNKFFLKSHF